jgi:hypothetical protein
MKLQEGNEAIGCIRAVTNANDAKSTVVMVFPSHNVECRGFHLPLPYAALLEFAEGGDGIFVHAEQFSR